MKDPYKLLGIKRSATPQEIKSAFRKLAAKHHPDRNPDDPGAAQRFKEINAAYQILSDPEKRKMFDRFGAAGVSGSRSGGPFQGVQVDFSELNIDGIFGDLLEALGIKVGDKGHLRQELELSFEEAAFGCKKKLSYSRIATCQDCGGSGAEKGSKLKLCDLCGGRGRMRQQQGVFPIPVERTCSRCGGKGRVVDVPCSACRGVGKRSQQTEIEVPIPAGVESGITKRIQGKGNYGQSGRVGDLEIVVQVKAHEFFRRSGDNIICALPITFPQAALGDEIEIPTLEGKGIMRVPAGTQPGTMLRVKGKGIPKRVMRGRGDQLVEIQVEVPTEMSDEQKELIMQLAGELGESVQPQRRTFMEKLKDLFS